MLRKSGSSPAHNYHQRRPLTILRQSLGSARDWYRNACKTRSQDLRETCRGVLTLAEKMNKEIVINFKKRSEMVQPFCKTVWQCLAKLNIILPNGLVIILLGSSPHEQKTYIYTNTCMFIAAFFTMARNWKPPRCLSTENGKKPRYMHTMEYYLAIQRDELSSHERP